MDLHTQLINRRITLVRSIYLGENLVIDTMQMLSFLDNSSSQKVLKVLSDISNSINGSWALSGSISYRMQLPHINAMAGLRDIDIGVYPKTGQNPRLLVSKGIQQTFYVIAISKAGCGYYFRLIHKKTGTHVDIFSPFHSSEQKQVTLGSSEVNLIVPEEILFFIFYGLLRSHSKGWTIRQKTINNAESLWQVVDRKKVLSLLGKYRAEYESFLPQNLTSGDYFFVVEFLLNLQPSNRSYQYTYPSDCITTVNGITIESEVTHRGILGVKPQGDKILGRWNNWKHIKQTILTRRAVKRWGDV